MADVKREADKAPLLAGMRMKIGVMGGASGEFAKEHLDKAHRLGEAIAEAGCILITGGCPGLPYAAACGARQAGGFVIGISPGLSLDEHVDKYGAPTEFHDVLIYTGSGLMGREVVNIRSSDAVVIIGGRSGTLGELAIAFDEGKLIGVLTGTGGISDLAEGILKVCEKNTGARVAYSGEPERLVEEMIRVYVEAHHRRPSVFSEPAQKGEGPRDAVCGMRLEPGQVVAERTVGGKRRFFCSTACAAKFDAEPDRYAHATGA